jgi:hypothetical protein
VVDDAVAGKWFLECFNLEGQSFALESVLLVSSLQDLLF